MIPGKVRGIRETLRRLGSLFLARTQRVLPMNNRAQAMTATADITIKSRIMFLDLMWRGKRVQAASAKFLRLHVSERHNSSAGKGRCGLVLAVALVIVESFDQNAHRAT
jgi:hypothetical protein